MTKVRKEFRMEKDEAAELLRDIADALEEKEQLNMKFEGKKLVQPLTSNVPLRIYQDEKGTEIGFKLNKES